MNQAYDMNNYKPEESIGFLLKRCGSALTLAIDRELAPHDMTHAQLGIFLRLHNGTAKTASDLARDNMSDPGSMTRTLDRLEEKGFIARSRDADDRRVVQVVLTDKGLEMADQMVKGAIACLNHFLRDFAPDEVEQFKGFLRRMLANAEPNK
jgi:DNA-binding MarR family transcriptional regulator